MDNETHKTRNSLIVIGSVFILIGLSAVIPASWIGGKAKPVILPKVDLSLMTSPQYIAKDTNGDGSISWKEVVNDTLGAPTSTIEDIKKTQIDQASIDQLNDPNNLTASFSKNLYLTSAYLDKNGITDEQSKSQALTQLIQAEKAKLVFTTYGYKDIIVAKTESKESIRSYGNAIAPQLKAVLSEKTIADDMTSLNNFSKSNNSSDLLPLIKNKKHLDALINKLLTISVPPSAITYHILILNRLSRYRDTLDNLSKADTDPIRASMVADSYVETAGMIVKLFNQLSAYFDLQNIVFLPQESGYVFTVGYTMDKK